MVTDELPNFLEYSRKLKLFSDQIQIKLPLKREDRDKALLEYMEFTKEQTLILSQICHAFHFIKNGVEIAIEYKNAFSIGELRQFMKLLEIFRDSLRSE